MTDAPHHLRVEHHDGSPLGIDVRSPRLSWQLPGGAARQLRFRLSIDGRDTHWVDSDSNVLVPWPSDPLGSRAHVEWRVQVVTDRGESDWSATATFETGLLEPTDWIAEWIRPTVADTGAPSGRPAALLRGSFDLDEVPRVARLYATAHGIYETFLNGVRVGDHELSPGFTSYWDHVDVQAFDVTQLLVAGNNEWTAVVSDGWYRGKVGNNKDVDTYGDHTAFLAQLHADDHVFGTSGDWQQSLSQIVAADLSDGQVTDFTRVTSEWSPVVVIDHGNARLTASPAPPSRRVQELRPVSVTRLDDTRQIVDLGQNINGWVRLGPLGPTGTELTLTHGEALDEHGDVTLEHLCFGHLRLSQTDRVVSGGNPGESFEPRHTTHGFQYVRIEGHPDTLSPDDVTGVVVHTDLRRTGTFHCSDDRINRFHEITDWSFRDNACEIPTDCPQRERSGWTGDWQAFLPSAAFLYDVAGFSYKWLRSLIADQLPNGCLTNTAPEPRRARRAVDDLTWTGMLGSAGWGDAIALVPWHLRTAYGDDDVLAMAWPAMVGWVEFAAERARTGRHASRVAARPEPAPHEQYLWDSGWHWGEWLEPGEPVEPFWQADQGSVATAYLHHTSALVARIGRLLGHDAEAERYETLAANALHAWRTEYLHDGRITPDTQANHVRALAFGLVPDELRPAIAQRLVELVRQADTHLSTGFLATPLLLPTLADHGHLDVAYDLLFQDTPPSWLAMVARGASTVWENWEGIDADGRAHESLNHYSKGAVIAFLHTHVVGIRPLDEHPGYRRFRVAPMPDRRLQWAEASHDSPHGRISVSWKWIDDTFDLSVTVPPGTTAEVVLPNGTSHEQGPGTATYTSRLLDAATVTARLRRWARVRRGAAIAGAVLAVVRLVLILFFPADLEKEAATPTTFDAEQAATVMAPVACAMQFRDAVTAILANGSTSAVTIGFDPDGLAYAAAVQASDYFRSTDPTELSPMGVDRLTSVAGEVCSDGDISNEILGYERGEAGFITQAADGRPPDMQRILRD